MSILLILFTRIPVYIVNALYLWPITLWTYLKYGRPAKPQKEDYSSSKHEHSHHEHDHTVKEQDSTSDKREAQDHSHHHHHGSERSIFATITVAVCHCGTGCVLGDLVGEWLIYGANITVAGRMLWAEFLIDFGFALLFGIFFQYFSIAPMSGDYGLKTLVRAAKADFLSLTFFEIGLFGWMAILQVAIFNWELEMNQITYWWMMQVSIVVPNDRDHVIADARLLLQIGMFLGHWTAFPINWFLMKKGIKEPCA